ncbi:MAG: GAP family protein [Campylobacterota bacterium]|nr:GAP family protein [Campylobacterota bacterium]
MENILTQIIPITLAMAIPMPMLKATQYLLMKRPLYHLSIFMLTWGVVLFLLLSSTVYIGDEIKEFLVFKHSSSDGFHIMSWIHLIVGFLLLSKGVKILKLSIQNKAEPITSKKLYAKPIDIIKFATKTELIGLKNTTLLLIIVYIIISSNIPEQSILSMSLIISTVSMLWFSMLMLIYLMLGKDREHIIKMIRNWLENNVYTILIITYIYLGVYFFSSAISDFIQIIVGLS